MRPESVRRDKGSAAGPRIRVMGNQRRREAKNYFFGNKGIEGKWRGGFRVGPGISRSTKKERGLYQNSQGGDCSVL